MSLEQDIDPSFIATIFTNQVLVSTAGTAVQFPSQILGVGVIIQALSTNVSSIFIGVSGVTASSGFELQPGQACSACVANLNNIYVNAITNGDGCCFVGS